jgi:TonB family protein
MEWRIGAAVIAAILLIGVPLAVYFGTRPSRPFAEPEAAAPAEQEEDWAWMADQDRLLVRPTAIGRPVLNPAMQMTILSGYADLEFTVGADGKASDIRVVRESARDLGYGAEARRLVAGATWPTQWRGRSAPYAGGYRVIFPPGRAGRAIAPLSIASPNLTREILALRRNAAVTLLLRVTPEGAVESARVIDADVESAAVTAEALRVAMGARFPANPAGFAYDTQLIVRFDVLGALHEESETPVGPTVSLSEVPFTQRPGARDFARHYPRRALNAGTNGRVTLSCTVRRDLRLQCSVAEEDPPGAGFGAAALRIARQFRAARQFPDGQSTVGAQVRVPLVFQVE